MSVPPARVKLKLNCVRKACQYIYYTIKKCISQKPFSSRQRTASSTLTARRNPMSSQSHSHHESNCSWPVHVSQITRFSHPKCVGKPKHDKNMLSFIHCIRAGTDDLRAFATSYPPLLPTSHRLIHRGSWSPSYYFALF